MEYCPDSLSILDFSLITLRLEGVLGKHLYAINWCVYSINGLIPCQNCYYFLIEIGWLIHFRLEGKVRKANLNGKEVRDLLLAERRQATDNQQDSKTKQITFRTLMLKLEETFSKYDRNSKVLQSICSIFILF